MNTQQNIRTEDIGHQILDNVIPRMISVSELQTLLSVGRDVAYSMVRRKDFPSIRIGREYRVLVDDLGDWLRKQQRNK